jgi:spore coat protein U-like protein
MTRLGVVTSSKRRLAAVAGAAAIATLAIAAPASAATATSNFQVTATVVNACSIAAGDLAFGTYSVVTGAAVNATSSILVTCTLGAGYTVALNAGATAGGSYTQRRMASGGDTLSYNLYTDAARTSIWGDATGSTATVAGSGNGLPQALTVYGQVLASQNVPGGLYSDTVTATITF